MVFRMVSSPGFFIKGVTKANFHSLGNTPVCSDEFTIFVIKGKRIDMCSFKILVGMGSNSQVVDLEDIISFLTSSSVSCLNLVR